MSPLSPRTFCFQKLLAYAHPLHCHTIWGSISFPKVKHRSVVLRYDINATHFTFLMEVSLTIMRRKKVYYPVIDGCVKQLCQGLYFIHGFCSFCMWIDAPLYPPLMSPNEKYVFLREMYSIPYLTFKYDKYVSPFNTIHPRFQCDVMENNIFSSYAISKVRQHHLDCKLCMIMIVSTIYILTCT